MRPLSQDHVEARSPNPAEAPALNPRYLSEPTEPRAMIGGLRLMPALCGAGARQILRRRDPAGGGGRL
jgi:choline dehydrogenase-like flavoprotein